MIYPDRMECKGCASVKLISEFQAFKARGKSYRKRVCKVCLSNTNKRWFKTNRDYRRKYATSRRDIMRAWRHGITPERYESILRQQSGKCPICLNVLDTKSKLTHVDHDHKSGRVRGVLCHWCNVALGHLKDNPAALKRAYNYLRSHSPNLDLFEKYSPYKSNLHENDETVSKL